MDLTVIGLMSGTSYDAIDAAVGRFSLSGETIHLRPLGLHTTVLEDALRARIAALLPPNAITIEDVCRLDTELGQRFGAVAAEADRRLARGAADLVVSHGQTVFHWVQEGRARGGLQLGAPAWIAEATGIPVISDVRTRDIARGGQGAPLASTLDALLVVGEHEHRRGALNLGGIANITVRDRDGRVVAYDLGPAGALLDQAVAEATGGAERMDRDGRLAARGRVSESLLEQLLADPYYALAPPKSTGKERFHAGYVRSVAGPAPIGPADLLATLTELTARLVARACAEWRLDELVCSGGGVRNPLLMARIRALTGPVRVRSIDEFGIPAQTKEGYLLALLGYLAWHGLDGTVPSATGASRGSIVGSLTPGSRPLVLPPPVSHAPRRLVVEGAGEGGRPRSSEPVGASTSGALSVRSPTEDRNQRTADIDRLAVLPLLERLNDEDALVAGAVRRALPALAELVVAALDRLGRGGRVHYFGAGTSGRLAMLDAVELPPTFGVPADRFVAHLAGGEGAVRRAREGSEDDEGQGAEEAVRSVGPDDVMIGVAASGYTRYVGGALGSARRAGAYTGLVTSNPSAPLASLADTVVVTETGAEPITGSTRMKAATAQKLVLNSFSTAVMVRTGHTWSNLMVDVAPTNAKLKGRVVRMLGQATGLDAAACEAALAAADNDPKSALVMLLSGRSAGASRDALGRGDGIVARALSDLAGSA